MARARLGIALALTAAALAPAPASAAVQAVPVGQFETPLALAHAPGAATTGWVYVVERAGRVKIASGRTVEPFLDISTRVSSALGEQGMWSIAFPADYDASGRFYVTYSNLAGNWELDEFRRSATDPRRADPSSRRKILEIPHLGFESHYAGQLAFGPDGLLYASTGDGGGAGDPLGNSQKLTSLLGKIIRLDPMAGTVSPEIVAYGLRNPWRFSFDGGDIVIADVGQDAWEEIDVIPAGSTSPPNFGWPMWEGNHRYKSGEAPGHVPPLIERPRNAGPCTSITGGYVAGATLPSIEGRYVYGDFCTGEIRSATLTRPVATDDRFENLVVPTVVAFGEDAAGCLYALSFGGPVWRLVDAPNALMTPCSL